MGSVPFPIPEDDQLVDKIGNLVLQANEKRDKAWHLEKEAIDLVEALIGY